MNKLYAAAALAFAGLSSGCGRNVPITSARPVANPSAYVTLRPAANPKFSDADGNFRWYINDSEFANKAEMDDYHAEREKWDVNAIGPARRHKKAKTLDEMAKEKGW